MTILKVTYKGEVIDPNDIVVFYEDYRGKALRGNIEDYGVDKYGEGYDEGYGMLAKKIIKI